MGDEGRTPPPLARRVPGAARAGPSSAARAARPELPEALLQRMQAVVNAARTQAAAEQEPGQAAMPQPQPAPQGVNRADPAAEPWSDADADFDTAPLPRLTASGAVARDVAPTVNKVNVPPDAPAKPDFAVKPGSGARPDFALKPDHSARPRRTLKPRRGAKADRTVRPDRNPQADRAAEAERQRAAQAQREHAAQAERERAAQAERERAAQVERERVEAERQRAAEAEQAARAEAERQRAAQAETDHAAQAEREQAAAAERSPQPEGAAEPEPAAEPENVANPFQALGAERAANAEPAAEPGDAAKRDDGKWLPEDYFRPLSAVRIDKARWSKETQQVREAQQDGEAQWGREARGDEEPRWKEEVQPDEEERPGPVREPRHRNRSGLAASVVALVIAAAVGIALFLRSSPGTGHDSGSRPASAAQIRSQAAAWVAQQVSRNVVVSCDHAMCAALAQHHFPSGNLHVLDSTSSNPAGATVIIATPTVRSQFGGSLESSLAPLVLAEFGTGNAQIAVRLIAPHGAAALRHSLAKDLVARKASGAELLGSPRIAASPI